LEKVGTMVQLFGLYPHLNASENICLAQLRVLTRSREQAWAKASLRASEASRLAGQRESLPRRALWRSTATKALPIEAAF
jgi:ABC-type polar amino acid transport system ATPase subunit